MGRRPVWPNWDRTPHRVGAGPKRFKQGLPGSTNAHEEVDPRAPAEIVMRQGRGLWSAPSSVGRSWRPHMPDIAAVEDVPAFPLVSGLWRTCQDLNLGSHHWRCLRYRGTGGPLWSWGLMRRLPAWPRPTLKLLDPRQHPPAKLLALGRVEQAA
jgi:hypothetical protein